LFLIQINVKNLYCRLKRSLLEKS